VLFAPVAFAGSAPSDSAGILSLNLENSSISPTTPTDRNYTNGIGLGWTSATGGAPAPIAGLMQSFFGPGEERISLGIFQQIFTPDETNINPPNPFERPYAAYLALHSGVIEDQANTESMVALDLGVVGPAAGGEEIQNGFHHLIGQSPDQGWGFQLHDEPTLELYGGRTWRVPLGQVGGLATDVLPAASLGLGNVRIYAQAGALLRIGTDLGADFGPNRLPPGFAGSPVFVPSRPFSWYAFIGADGQAVAHDLFLNGNTFSAGPHVTPYPYIGEFEVGVAMVIHGVRVSAVQVFSTRTWHNEQGNIFSFAALEVATRF
jgi:lipid A 3-O-deacylase